MKKIIVLSLISTALLTGCASKTPTPVVLDVPKSTVNDTPVATENTLDQFDYLEIARNDLDINACNLMADETAKKECSDIVNVGLMRMASDSNDASICKKITDSAKAKECLSYLN